jgi:hypothetical protein
MRSRIRHITVDSRDPHTQALFWAQVLGYTDDPGNPNAPGDPEALIVDPRGRHPGLLFLPVPEPKSVKNRVHLDLQPDQTRDLTVEALSGLGAAVVADHRRPDGTGWVVMADPEGNEFCVERSAAERAEPASTGPATGERAYPDVDTADERTMLEGMLEWYREGVVRKFAGLSSADAGRSLVGSSTTMAGILKHLALVEDAWFTDRFAGLPNPEPWASAPFDDDPDWEFHSAPHEDVGQLLALYEAACARSRAAAEGHDLDERQRGERPTPFNLRFAYVHMIEETARHLGHLDVLRELTDGGTGE